MATLNDIDRKLGGFLFGAPLRSLPALAPGAALAAALAWLSVIAADFIGRRILGFEKSPVSSVMVAVILGMIIGNAGLKLGACKPGLSFAVKKLLRLGIMLLGFRLSVWEASRYGAAGLPVILACVAGAFALSSLMARALKLPARLGTLIAVGTSICGVSAIAAAGPAIDAREEEVAYAVAVVTVFGILATLAYPYLAYALFGLDAAKAGAFLGTAVHDTSQVTGAALAYDQAFGAQGALDVATVTKLVRNLFMVAVVPLAAFMHNGRRRTEGDAAALGKKPSLAAMVPLFILGFVLSSTLRSVGDAGLSAGDGAAFGLWGAAAWRAVHRGASELGQNLIVVALAAVGLTTSFKTLKGLGYQPFLAGLSAALAVGAISAGILLARP